MVTQGFCRAMLGVSAIYLSELSHSLNEAITYQFLLVWFRTDFYGINNMDTLAEQMVATRITP